MEIKKGRRAIIDVHELASLFNEEIEERVIEIIGNPKFFKKRKRKKAFEKLAPIRKEYIKTVEFCTENFPEIVGTKNQKTEIILKINEIDTILPMYLVKGTRKGLSK